MSRRRSTQTGPRYYGWHKDIGQVNTAMSANNTVGAIVWALMAPCPVCGRRINETCIVPEGLERQGIFLHHERIAAGDRT